MQDIDLLGQHVEEFTINNKVLGDATLDYPLFEARRPCRLVSVEIVPGATITGQATNTFNLNVKTWTAAGVATERGNRDYLSGTNEVAMVKRSLYAPATPLNMAQGDHVTLERELVGSGLAMPALGVRVTYDYNR